MRLAVFTLVLLAACRPDRAADAGARDAGPRDASVCSTDACTGAVKLDVGFCPRVSISATPVRAQLGRRIELEARAGDAEPQVHWDPSTGEVADDDAWQTSYRCDALGPVSITAYALDAAGCESQSAVEVSCVP